MEARSRDNPLARRAEAVLDRLRPGLLADGGNVELAGVDDAGVARLVFQGRCARCPARMVTLRQLLEPSLRRAIPELGAVVPVPERALGPRRAR